VLALQDVVTIQELHVTQLASGHCVGAVHVLVEPPRSPAQGGRAEAGGGKGGSGGGGGGDHGHDHGHGGECSGHDHGDHGGGGGGGGVDPQAKQRGLQYSSLLLSIREIFSFHGVKQRFAVALAGCNLAVLVRSVPEHVLMC
jgi:hypothetical protein